MKSIERFSDRVENYVKFRPSYPPELVEFLIDEIGEPGRKACADIGSGTGIFTMLLLEYFQNVYAVEPNPEMRLFAEKTLATHTNFISVNSQAEKTTLPSESIDLITVAQAFHWFDRPLFATECQRILKPAGLVALIWNNRLTDTPFLQVYETLLQTYATDYNEVNHQNITDEILKKFFLGGYRKVVFQNKQIFDLAGVYGRVDSSSYAPKPHTPEFEILRKEIKTAFDEFSREGVISFNYETELYIGKVR